MAGAMRRMGIYLGLVEDDDARGYGRYDARQSDYVRRRPPVRRATPTTGTTPTTTTSTPPRRLRRGGPRGRGAARRPASPSRCPRAASRAARPIGLAPAGAGPSRVGAVAASAHGGVRRWAAARSAPPPPSSPSASRSPWSRPPRAGAGAGAAALPDHHAAPAHVQRGADHRRAFPRRHAGDHEPHRDGRRRRQAPRRLRRGPVLRPAR